MLVLTRQLDQSIVIGDDIQITVVEVKGDKIRLGIKAPRDVQVHRSEIYDAIQSENAAASNVRVGPVGRNRPRRSAGSAARRATVGHTPLNPALSQPVQSSPRPLASPLSPAPTPHQPAA